MPELPEVEVVRAGLEPVVTGAVIQGVHVFEPRTLRRHDQTRGDFSSLLTGGKILAAVRRGKFLWFPLNRDTTGDSTPVALVAHLGMSGQFLLRTPGEAVARQLRVRLHLDVQSSAGVQIGADVEAGTHGETGAEPSRHKEVWLDFVDQRIFGWLLVDRLVSHDEGAAAGYAGAASGSWQALIPERVAHIARDPLDPAFDTARFVAALDRSGSAIKRVLLDQSLVSGIGNIYADEALWRARIHPECPSISLSSSQAVALLEAVRTVFQKALAEGGTSFDAQYLNVNGVSGYFARKLHVYGREGEPCNRCGSPIKRAAFMNRSSHFCPGCQRKR